MALYFPLTREIKSAKKVIVNDQSINETARHSKLLSIETFSPDCRINVAISFISPAR